MFWCLATRMMVIVQQVQMCFRLQPVVTTLNSDRFRIIIDARVPGKGCPPTFPESSASSYTYESLALAHATANCMVEWLLTQQI